MPTKASAAKGFRVCSMHGFQLLKAFYVEIEGETEELEETLTAEPYMSMTVDGAELYLVWDDSEPDKLSLKAPIGQVDLENAKHMPILTILLEANFEFSGTRGATIGVNSSSGEVCLFYQLHCVEVSQDALAQLLMEYSNVVKIWQESLVSLTQGVA